MSADDPAEDPTTADPFPDESEEEEEEEDNEAAAARASRRNWFMFWMSLVVVLIIVPLSVVYGDQFFGPPSTGAPAADAAAAETPAAGAPGQAAPAQVTPAPIATAQSYLIPYLTCLAGVLLFIMSTARLKGDDWDLGRYWGEHAYRVAQAFAYLFVVWWAWSKVSAGGELQGTYIRPNILGFLVGFFILRVERAMDGLGDKFEEMLFAVLPRAARYTVVEERKRQQVRAGYKLTDIATQWDVLSTQVGNEEAVEIFEDRLKTAIELASGADPEKARLAADEVSRMFERLKAEAGEILIPVEELVGR